MNFIEAMELLINNKNIRRKSWDDKDLHVFFSKECQCLMTSWMYKGKVKTYCAPFEDLFSLSASDWEEYFELHTFEEAIVALKNGKTIKRKLWTTKVIERDFCDDYSIEFAIDDVEANDWIIMVGKV